MKIMSNKISDTSEENSNLKIKVDQLENQLRTRNVVIHGLPEASYDEAASACYDEGLLVGCLGGYRAGGCWML